MTALYLCLALLLPTSSIAWDMLRDTNSRPVPRPKRQYEAPRRESGGTLPKRPEGRHALKEEIAQTPPGYVPAPPVALRTRKAHADWPWDTAEIEMRWNEHFAGQPDDQAVQREWAGTGR